MSGVSDTGTPRDRFLVPDGTDPGGAVGEPVEYDTRSDPLTRTHIQVHRKPTSVSTHHSDTPSYPDTHATRPPHLRPPARTPSRGRLGEVKVQSVSSEGYDRSGSGPVVHVWGVSYGGGGVGRGVGPVGSSVGLRLQSIRTGPHGEGWTGSSDRDGPGAECTKRVNRRRDRDGVEGHRRTGRGVASGGSRVTAAPGVS